MKCTWNKGNSAHRAYSIWIFSQNEEYLGFCFMMLQMFLNKYYIFISENNIWNVPNVYTYLPQLNQKMPGGI